MGRSADFDKMLQKKYKLMERAQANAEDHTGILKQQAGTSQFTAETGRLGLAPETTRSDAALINAKANIQGVQQAPGLVKQRASEARETIRETQTAGEMTAQSAFKRKRMKAKYDAANAPAPEANYKSMETGDAQFEIRDTKTGNTIAENNKAREALRKKKRQQQVDSQMEEYIGDGLGFRF